jgi:hypothetical protein
MAPDAIGVISHLFASSDKRPGKAEADAVRQEDLSHRIVDFTSGCIAGT